MKMRQKAVRRNPVWKKIAFKAGKRYAFGHPIPEGTDSNKFLNELWCRFCFSDEGRGIPNGHYLLAADAFLEGYFSNSEMKKPDCVLLPTNKSVGAVVTVLNKEETISDVLEQLRRMPLHEIIVVVNGSKDGSFAAARKCPGATILHYPESLGHDVGRSIGAKYAESEMILFLDGDIPVKAEKLIPLVRAIHKGWDVGLNNINPFIGAFSRRDSVMIIKEFLNRVLNRADLGVNSLSAIPHILSRHAIEQIGIKNLMVPPKAQVLAIQKGLRIRAPVSIDVVSTNKIRTNNNGLSDPVSKMIIGDHLEAIHTLIHTNRERLEFQDSIRKRFMLKRGSG